MNANVSSSESSSVSTRKKNINSGIILIAIGLGLLLMQVIEMPQVFPLVLGGIFLAAGVVTRKAGLIIPGGIISGVGLGTLSTVNAWFYPTNSVESGGVFLLFFAMGWFAITLLSALCCKETHTWALIPGTIMAVIGGLVLMGESGVKVLEQVGRYWPVILVLIGANILYKSWKTRE